MATIRRYFGRCRYENVYRLGSVASGDVAKVLTALSHRYKSHRKTQTSDILVKYGINEDTWKVCYCSDCTGAPVECNSAYCPHHAKK